MEKLQFFGKGANKNMYTHITNVTIVTGMTSRLYTGLYINAIKLIAGDLLKV